MKPKHNTLLGIFLITTLLWSTTSSAASLLGIYAGVSAGKAEIVDLTPTDDDTAAKVYAGYRILGPIAVEVAQVDLGKYYSDAIAIDGTSVDAVLYLPAGLVNVFAKAGLFNWNADYTGGLTESGTSSKFGFGVEYNLLLNIDFRLEWETYTDVMDTTTTTDITVLSAGVNIAF